MGNRTVGINKERIVRALTFWLRPAFALRVVNRFQRLVGFDRSMALASSALSAVVPLSLIAGVLLKHFGFPDTAQRIIHRYHLTGGGAQAVSYVFSPDADTTAGVGVFGVVFLLVSVLSFSRAVQRLYEQAWELPPLSVRNTLNGLRWALVLVGYLALSSWVFALLGAGPLGLLAATVQAPLSCLFLLWSGRTLTAKRTGLAQLLPFAAIGAVAEAGYSVATSVYLPRVFDSSANRYGAIGAVFALLTALFGMMLVLVAAAAAGREVRDELDRIGRGERPADDEVRRQWQKVLAQARLKWATAREQWAHRRGHES
ncbi:YihY/virulence factor BrkB family protein [Kitasatospora viridis]|uniref:Membrane protein n=1 Tax=Kitasatospora viridis TaxID=281105 RepID=A0A561SFC1_9ACTN|nr:YihY/virulence factor BrkB family protein [Kitasatospora viridis]TWF73518.1 membrane protein [Kitasatospora viridis]